MWSSLSPLTRGRLTAAIGVIVISTDAPSFRLLRLRLPASAPAYGFAVLVWRSVFGFLASSVSTCYLAGGWSGLCRETEKLGGLTLLLASVFQTVGQIGFTSAVAMTTAANVVVVLALSPPITALISRFALGVSLPRHTWIATVSGFLAVALVFAGQLGGSPRELQGCLVALLAPCGFGAYMCLAASRPDANTLASQTLTTLLSLATALLVLSATGQLDSAQPASPADYAVALYNGAVVTLGVQVFGYALQAIPGPEAALVSLLETVLSPFLVYAAVGERVSPQSIVAGVLIVLILAAHTIYDMRLEGQAHAKTAVPEDGVELLRTEAAPAEAGA